MDFADDVHLSTRHARVGHDSEGFFLEDLSSSNGTYLLMRDAQVLQHGDYLWVGQQLLRVEVTA
jgi:pSer/pThr/pTyr-binding forkhead associated (FHA) protein